MISFSCLGVHEMNSRCPRSPPPPPKKNRNARSQMRTDHSPHPSRRARSLCSLALPLPPSLPHHSFPMLLHLRLPSFTRPALLSRLSGTYPSFNASLLSLSLRSLFVWSRRAVAVSASGLRKQFWVQEVCGIYSQQIETMTCPPHHRSLLLLLWLANEQTWSFLTRL